MKLLIHSQTCTFEVWEWISNFISDFTGHVINYPSTLRKTRAKHHVVVCSRWRTDQRTCPGADYERQPVITGHRPPKWRRGDSETKQKSPSKYAHILLPDEFAITFYIIQLNSLCLNYNLVSLSHAKTPMAQEIARELGRFPGDDLSSHRM